MLYFGKKTMTKYQKIPDGKGGFKFIESNTGKYTKDDIETFNTNLTQKEKSERSRKQKKSLKNVNLIGWIIVILIFGSCYGISLIGQNIPDPNPKDVLTPAERKETCYELYDTPDLRGELIACVAKVNFDL